MSSANNDSFVFSFSIWMSFFFLFPVWFLWLGLPILCWIGVVREGILVLFLSLVESSKFLSIEYDVGCRSVIYGLYDVEECSLYSHFVAGFYHKWVLYLIKCFFPICWYDQVVFVFAFTWCICLLICEYCTILVYQQWNIRNRNQDKIRFDIATRTIK